MARHETIEEIEAVGIPTRAEEDLDSITLGSPSKMQVKIYFNHRKDATTDLKKKLEEVLEAAQYGEVVLKAGGP